MGPVFQALRQLETVERPTVLITGETGTGKELVARAVHVRGRRSEAPFVVVDCAGLSEHLIESELFGHERGAFTGATTCRAGLLEAAGRGTVFLDEIGELPLGLQGRLLHALECRTLRRVGGTRTLTWQAGVLAATNRDLQAELRAGRFRSDLYFRLAVVPIHLPPLRDRLEDLVLLAQILIQRANRSWGRQVTGLSQATLAKMECYPWPGNVRELRNTIDQAVALHEGGMIEPRHLPKEVRLGLKPGDPALIDFILPEQGVDLEAMERDLLLQAMERAGDNKAKAARLLGIGRGAMRYRLVHHGIGAEPLPEPAPVPSAAAPGRSEGPLLPLRAPEGEPTRSFRPLHLERLVPAPRSAA